MNTSRFAFRSRPRSVELAVSLAVAGLAAASHGAARAAEVCTAKSAKLIMPVVELYTSEGCNSCPPADRWLSKLKTDPDVVALAFHVDYWDRLGWKDRFASAAYTDRQAQEQSTNGARFSYTPQVVVDGRDRTDWPSLGSSIAPTRTAPVAVALVRDGEQVTATVQPAAGAPKRLSAYWAVTEQNHVTAVKAGENEGVTLHHDFVVRDYRPVAAWTTKVDAPETLHFNAKPASEPGHTREVNLVVLDADSGKPVQAIKLGC